MAAAFDRVPRHALVQALRWAGATEQIIHVILQLHNLCSYVIQHGRYQGRVNMRRGVKQGCTLAPLLWTIFSTYLAQCVGLETDYQWMLQCMTLYADDSHAHWEISAVTDLHFMRKCIHVIFKFYKAHGMLVKPHKSACISGIVGNQGKKWPQQWHVNSRGGALLNLWWPC